MVGDVAVAKLGVGEFRGGSEVARDGGAHGGGVAGVFRVGAGGGGVAEAGGAVDEEGDGGGIS